MFRNSGFRRKDVWCWHFFVVRHGHPGMVLVDFYADWLPQPPPPKNRCSFSSQNGHQAWPIIEPDHPLTRHHVEVCEQACRVCAEECDRHASSHEHCRHCAETCRECEQACREALQCMGG